MLWKSSCWALVAGTVCLIIGLSGSFIGLEELRVALHCGAEPRTISCAELAAHGPGNNAYITLTNYSARWDGSLTWSNTPNGPWYSVVVPLAPATGARIPRPQDVHAVIVINRVRNCQELQKVLATGKLTGVIKSRGTMANDPYLLQRNPGIRPDRCWTIWEGHTAWAPTLAGGLVAFALVVFVVGVFLIVRTSQPATPTDQAGATVVFVMVPLARILAGLSSLGRSWLSPGARAALLLMSGLPVLMVGGVLVWKGGLLSLESSAGQMVLGALLVNIGLALFVLGCAASLQSGNPPESADEAQQEPAPDTPYALQGVDEQAL